MSEAAWAAAQESLRAERGRCLGVIAERFAIPPELLGQEVAVLTALRKLVRVAFEAGQAATAAATISTIPPPPSSDAEVTRVDGLRGRRKKR